MVLFSFIFFLTLEVLFSYDATVVASRMLHLFPLYCGLLPLNILFFSFFIFFHRMSFSFLCISFFFVAVFMSFNNLIIDFNTASDPTDVRKYISFINKNQSSTEYYRVHDVTSPSKFVCQVFKMAAAAFNNHRFRLTPTVFPLLSNFS